MPDSRKIGIIGLGKMGLPIAGHLVHAGHEVVAFDPEPDACERARQRGVETLGSVRGVAESSDATIVLVGTEKAAVQVCLDDEDPLLCPDGCRTIIMCSTVAPAAVREVAEKARERGVHVLDAPVCRGEPAAAAGTLLVLGSGDRGVFEEWRPVLEVFGSDVAYLGAAGAGQIAKSINNYLLWSAIVATYEGMLLARHHGLELDGLMDALRKSSGASYALDTWRMGRDMPWAEKDMRIVLEAFEDAGLQAPLSRAVEEAIGAVKAAKAEWQGDRTDGSMDEFVRSR